MSKKTQSTKTPNAPRVRVLYQNLNGVWYAFAENGGELYFGKVPAKASASKKGATKTTEQTDTVERTKTAA